MAARNFVKHLAYTTMFTFALPKFKTPFHLPNSLSTLPPTRQWRLLNSIATAKHSTSSEETPLPDIFSAPYYSVSIRCGKDVVDMLSEALLCFGASSTSVDEHDDNDGDSDETCITSIFSEHDDVVSCISHAADSIGMKKTPSYEVKVGEQANWVKKTQESFYPTEVTEGLWIVPEWRSPPDTQATNIILNPGLAFGTGEHATTKLCLLLLHSLIKGGEVFLDYGTGSGILAIAALKFGAAAAVGLDVDPLAITSARQNADLNNIEPDKLQLHLVPKSTEPTFVGVTTNGVVDGHGLNIMEDISEKEKYDVVIANILLNPLLDLADNIVSYAKPGAIVGLSGIISEQIPYIIERYSGLLEDMSVSEIDDWACVRGTKKVHVAGSRYSGLVFNYRPLMPQIEQGRHQSCKAASARSS